ncbi:hypothetical protein B0T17DRAFT_587923 [Bombardia bombarda]|uniref:Aminoglycoside phosphotransferase domain-containing protein n=1 Tax=Bombardia bombarda TaxID=252184 RepID=A0AA39XN02_9PEZI|nr:hypothetical protein B0T17DRAFT_587923 [Bombardia bombarda]
MTSRFFDCSVPDCARPSARSVGAGCDICCKHFCGVHMLPNFHKCGSTNTTQPTTRFSWPTDRLRAQINDEAVCELASSLNDGRACTIEYSSKIAGSGSLMGCANYHARIRFDDDVSWLMRVPRVTGYAVGLPVSLAEYLIRSEYVTLKFLETSTTVPAPRAFWFGIPSEGTDRGVGVCFLLMEELPGRPWDGGGDKTRVWKGLAEIYAELERRRFTRAGSLYVESPEDDVLPLREVSAAASDRFVGIKPYGPFETAAAYYRGWVEKYLALIVDGQMYPQFPVEAYLVYRFLRDEASRQLSDFEDGDGDEKELFLKHVDDKGDHLLVDGDSNIIGIIDCQMARVVPRREAFAVSLVTADMRELCDGNVSISADDVALSDALREKGSASGLLASYRGDEKVRRLFWGLGLEPKWVYALPLAKAILKVFRVEQG